MDDSVWGMLYVRKELAWVLHAHAWENRILYWRHIGRARENHPDKRGEVVSVSRTRCYESELHSFASAVSLFKQQKRVAGAFGLTNSTKPRRR